MQALYDSTVRAQSSIRLCVDQSITDEGLRDAVEMFRAVYLELKRST